MLLNFLPAPVLATCGWSGAGKTTLLEAAIPRLVAAGLRVAAVKHDAHGIAVDRPGKDSDRLFQAGAAVLLRSPQESFARLPGGDSTLEGALRALTATHDLVLVEGHKDTPLPKVWLEHEGGIPAPAHLDRLLAALPGGGGRLSAFLSLVETIIREHFAVRPVLGGVLVGGASSRMGRAKHLLRVGRRTLLERVGDAVAPHVTATILLGTPPTPAGRRPCLPDAPGITGPLAGMLAALRWHPFATWLIAACDMPALTAEALAWVLSHRRPGVWAVIPQDAHGRLEPLGALWEPQAANLLEQLVLRGEVAPRLVAPHPKVLTPPLPPEFVSAFANVNTPAELATARRRRAHSPVSCR